MEILFCVFFLTSLVNADHWGYPAELANGVIKGNESWGGQCSVGRRQSPIDLAEEAAVKGQFSRMVFLNYTNPIKNGKVRNTGHSIQVDILSGQDYLMSGGGLPGIYKMDQMHFHWASEHTINSERYGLELHIVSHEIRFDTFAEALDNKYGIAVLAVLFHVSEKHNRFLKNILDSTEAVKNEAGHSSLIKTPITPNDFLPKSKNSFFRYEGSLTTPNCDESVIWTVLTESTPFAMEQIERFKELKDENGEQLTHNFRQLQRLHSRPLIFSKVAETEYNTAHHALILTSVILLTQILIYTI